MTDSHPNDDADPDSTDHDSTDPDPDPDLPDALRESLDAVVEELAAGDGLFVALDFDGTLASIEDRPDEATIPDETRETVAALADESGVEVAVVSGRELADVCERVGLDDAISYAGNHGLELHADEYEVHPTASDAEADVADLCDRLADDLDHVEGVIVEDKNVTATVHHRLVDDEQVPEVVETVESLVADREDVRLTTGKDVLELRPAVEWDKGEAVEDLHDRLVPDDEEWFPMYVGDDTTDEAAFVVLGDRDRGLGVKVGEDPDTEAPYRVADTEAVRELLAWLDEYGVAVLDGDADADSVPTGEGWATDEERTTDDG